MRFVNSISDSIFKNLNESVYTDNKRVKGAKDQYNLEKMKKPHIMRGTIDTENVGSTKSIEKKIERTPYKKPRKATKKIVAESANLKEAVAYINGKALKVGDKIKDFRGDEHEFVGVTAPGTAFGGASGKIQVKSGDSVREFYPQVFNATIKESNNVCENCGRELEEGKVCAECANKLNEDYSSFSDRLIDDLESGILDWESVCRACIKYMPDDDVRDMAYSNEFYVEECDNQMNEEAKGEKENGGYKVDEQIYKLSDVLAPQVEKLRDQLKEKIDYLKNREDKTDKENVLIAKLESAYNSFNEVLTSIESARKDS